MVVPHRLVSERRPSERSEADQDATAGSLRVGLSATGTNVSDHPRLVQLFLQNFGNAKSGAKMSREALDALCAGRERLLGHVERPGVQTAICPLLIDERDPEICLKRPRSPKAQFDEEDEEPITVSYDKVIEFWQD